MRNNMFKCTVITIKAFTMYGGSLMAKHALFICFIKIIELTWQLFVIFRVIASNVFERSLEMIFAVAQ